MNHHAKDRLQQLGNALQSQIEDQLTCAQCQQLLPDYMQTEQESGTDIGEQARWAAVRDHLALCPYCLEAYQQLQEWLTASLADAIPNANQYPAFDLSFLESPAPAPSPLDWPFALLEQSRQQGRAWVQAASQALYLLFAPPPSPALAGWVTKSDPENSLLQRITLDEAEYPGWEIEALLFATDEGYCQLEVSLYALAQPETTLGGIAVTLFDGVESRVALTDANGLAEFAAIARMRLPELTLRIDLPTSPDQPD